MRKCLLWYYFDLFLFKESNFCTTSLTDQLKKGFFWEMATICIFWHFILWGNSWSIIEYVLWKMIMIFEISIKNWARKPNFIIKFDKNFFWALVTSFPMEHYWISFTKNDYHFRTQRSKLRQGPNFTNFCDQLLVIVCYAVK